MTLSVALFVLRIIGGGLLLLFFGLVSWFIVQDMRATIASMAERGKRYGQLEVIANDAGAPAVGTIIPLLPLTGIGRASSNTVVLPDGYASSEHALIAYRSGQWWLEDQGSRNGTLLNGVEVDTPVVVSAGDLIAVGGTRLKISFDVE